MKACSTLVGTSCGTLAIVFVHVALVPIAIAATLQAYGFENAMTIHNQITWTPIIAAQSRLKCPWVRMLGLLDAEDVTRRAQCFLAI